ncbi:hypothetical protein GE21DRAFT_15 [Neurospora crassa]|uniref:Zn(2)-C6 fungal-type domain-containing protein n=1 Tax=Neurospora crassa (strain ATCC 24698 / 74-OR23-1A / CBS 708.71 / DSM 1257 / FGSC 987) TaxID=367110 RepID=A7UX74_NEUCR|nr:hypothetical protein NCU10501 [Neurospora crassa OR74A]EDO64965.1 hypothetical protein NCU10501 [Neurospora crassa OR74A]KHE80624.1 hypothetical protein GE21DRAFT_15 [Neurospora crassa]|eukprot:XP_001728056.1 hypothetical protein NCU10501 [Neurospora crassa OR74A]
MIKTKADQTTKWGTACAQCAAAKAKCSRTSELRGSKCDRCERLLKTCTERMQRPRKPRRSRTPRKEYASSSIYVDTDGSLSPPFTTSTADFTSTSIGNLAADISLQQAPLKSATSSPLLSITLSPPPALGTSVPLFDNLQNCPCSPSNPTADEDAVQTFLTQIQPSFPFILVPNNVDSQALAVERPVLMSAIRLAAATTSTATTNVSESTLLSQVYQFVNHVSRMVTLRGECTLEMLMAAVMVLGRWRWWCEQHRGGFNSLLGIAEGLVQDLGLNRNPRQTQEEEERVTDIKKRLLLGVWYLRSCSHQQSSRLTCSNASKILKCRASLPTKCSFKPSKSNILRREYED